MNAENWTVKLQKLVEEDKKKNLKTTISEILFNEVVEIKKLTNGKYLVISYYFSHTSRPLFTGVHSTVFMKI